MTSRSFIPLSDVENRYPLPIAHTYWSLTQACARDASAVEKFIRLKDCFDTVNRYLALALIAFYVRSNARNTETDRSVIRKLVRPSAGDWPTLLAELAPQLNEAGHPLVEDICRALLVMTEQQGRQLHRKKGVMKSLLGFPAIRNEYLGHSLTRRDLEYEDVVNEWGDKLNDILCEADFLIQWKLFYAVGIASGEDWMGHTQPVGIFSFQADLPSEFSGKFLLVNEQNVIDLSPFVLRLRCPTCNAVRLCMYDSQQTYTDTKKAVRLIELPGAHRFSSSDPMAQLEAIFDPSLLQQEYVVIYQRLREVEGRILDQSRLIEEHADTIGRSFLDDQINDFFSNSSKGIFLLTGQPGIGKTAYLSNYVRRHTECVHFFFSRTSGFTSLDDAIQSIFHQLLKLLNITDLSPAENAREQFIKLRNLLTSLDSPALAKVTGRLIIVLDAIDEAEVSPPGVQLLDLLSIDLPYGVYFIISSRESPAVISLSTRSEVTRFHIDPASEENLKDAEAYVAGRLGHYELGADLNRRIARSSEGNFLILKHIVGDLLVLIEEKPDEFHSEVERLILHTSGTINDFYAGLWHQVIPSRERDLETIRAILDIVGLLSVAKSPLRTEDLSQILRQRQFETELAIAQIRPFLEVRSEEICGEVSNFYKIYHSTFRDYVRKRLEPDLRRYHLALIEYCQEGGADEYLRRYCSEYLVQHIVESESGGADVSQWSFDELRSLLTRETALARRKIEGSYSGFLREVDSAIELAKQDGLRTFPELLEFCFIKSHILSAMSNVPIDIFAALLVLDGTEKAQEAVESIGDKGQRAQAYAALSLVCPDDSERWEFIQRAVALAKHCGNAWEIADNLSSIGRLLVNNFPSVGVEAIRDAFEVIMAGGEAFEPSVMPETTRKPLEQLIAAYEHRPDDLAPIVPRIVEIVIKVAKPTYLLDLAYVISDTDMGLAMSILDNAWEELEEHQLSIKRSETVSPGPRHEVRSLQMKYAQVLTMIGKRNIAEERLPELARESNLSKLKEAVDLLSNGDYKRALSLSDHPIIRRRGLRGLLASGEIVDAVAIAGQLPKHIGLAVLAEYASEIVKQGFHFPVLTLARDLRGKEHLYLKGTGNVLIAAIARELAHTEPDLARSIVEEYYSRLSSRAEIPYWGELRLIAATAYRKGEHEAKGLISAVGLQSKEKYVGGYLEELKKQDQWKTSRQKGAKPHIPPGLRAGWELFERKEWNEFREWLNTVEPDDWRHNETKIELVRALAESGQRVLAWQMASKISGLSRDRALAHVRAVSLRSGVGLDDLSLETPDASVAIIEAEELARRNVPLACSFLRLLGDWLLSERQADDLLAWSLSEIALFLYQHGYGIEAERFFLLGYHNWIQYHEAFMRSDIEYELTFFTDQLLFSDRFSIIQEVIIYCSSCKQDDIVQFIHMFADDIVKNVSISELERILQAIKRSREWMLVDVRNLPRES
jgi:hypothetical protein